MRARFAQWGHTGSDHLGRSLAGVGDVDGDGCDEYAVGSTHENTALRDQGIFRVVYGWGHNCSESEPKQVTLGSGIAYRYIGYDLDGQEDLDGDGIDDLAVGAPYFRIPESNEQTGGTVVISGRWLAELKSEALPVASAEPPDHVFPLGEAGYGLPQWVYGPRSGTLAGHAVGLIPDGSGFGRSALAVGWPRGELHNAYRTAGVVVYRSDATGTLGSAPHWGLSGETASANSDLGMTLDGYVFQGKVIWSPVAATATGRQ